MVALGVRIGLRERKFNVTSERSVKGVESWANVYVAVFLLSSLLLLVLSPLSLPLLSLSLLIDALGGGGGGGGRSGVDQGINK